MNSLNSDIQISVFPPPTATQSYVESERRRWNQFVTERFARSGPRMTIEGPLWCAHGTNIQAGNGLYLGSDVKIRDDGPVVMGDNVIIGPRASIQSSPDKPVNIGTLAWIGEGAQIQPGVTIGESALVAAGSVVESNVPARTLVMGNPAKMVGLIQA